jgi:nicotinamidase-related amidase
MICDTHFPSRISDSDMPSNRAEKEFSFLNSHIDKERHCRANEKGSNLGAFELTIYAQFSSHGVLRDTKTISAAEDTADESKNKCLIHFPDAIDRLRQRSLQSIKSCRATRSEQCR